MIVRDFLCWVDTAPVVARVEASSALARAWLFSKMSEEERQAALAALTVLLDDPAVEVRMAVAHALCRHADVPEHLISALAADVEDVSEIVLEFSPVLRDPELVDILAQSSSRLQSAIARRRGLSAAVCAALGEVGDPLSCITLLGNQSAAVLKSSLCRMADRFWNDPGVRDQLLARDDLPMKSRYGLLRRLTEGLADHPVVRAKVPDHQAETFVADASDRVALRLAGDSADATVRELVCCLRESGHLTPKLILRALSSGRLRLFVAALADLGGTTADRVLVQFHSEREAAIKSVARRAGLPARTHAAVAALVRAYSDGNCDFVKDANVSLACKVNKEVMASLPNLETEDPDLYALLRRYAVETARLEAREYVKLAMMAA